MTIVRADLADAEAIWAVERQQLLDDLAVASVQQTTAETLLAEERRKSQGSFHALACNGNMIPGKAVGVPLLLMLTSSC